MWKKSKVSGAEVHAIMNLCMAATYDPDPQAPLGFRLPFHLETGELIEARWQRWLEQDPVRLVGRYARNLRRALAHQRSADAQRCRHESACPHLMIGRGALSLPNLAAVIQLDASPLPWPAVLQLLLDYCSLNIGGRDQGSYFVARIKQWFSYLKRQYPQAPELFSQLRTLNNRDALVQCLAAERQRQVVAVS